MPKQSGLARFLISAAVTAILAAGLGGCQTMGDVTGALASSAPSPDSDPQRAIEAYGERYRANPKDADIALAYGRQGIAQRTARSIRTRLQNATLSDIFQKTGLHEFLTGFIADNGRLGEAIAEQYLR